MNAWQVSDTGKTFPRLTPRLRNLLVCLGQIVFLVLLGSPILLLNEGWINSDSFRYLDMAFYFFQKGEYIVQQDHFSSWSTGMRAPLFSLMLSFLFHLTGPTISSAITLTKVSAFLSLCIVYLLGKRLYGWRVGLAAASLAGASRFLIDFPAHILLDQVQSLFMLLSLYAYVLALNRERFYYSVLSGYLLGLGFLVKEVAVIWVTLPLLVFLWIGAERYRFHLLSVLGFWLGFALPASVWWGYYFIQTGKFFLLDTVFLSWTKPIFESLAITNLGYWLIAVAGALLIVLFSGSRLLNVLKKGTSYVTKMNTPLRVLGQAMGWFVLVSLLIFFTITITRLGTWIYSPAEIVPRLFGFFELWYRLRVVPAQPLLYYAPFALVVVAWSAIWRKNKSDVLILACILACIPLFLAMGFPGRNYWSARYLMAIYWISYLVLGRILILLADLLSRVAESRIKFIRINPKCNLALDAPLLICITICLAQIISLVLHHDPMEAPNPHDIWNNEGVQAASVWINEHLPAKVRIASTFHYPAALDFYTEGRYSWFPLYDLGWSPDSANPIDHETSLFVLDDDLHLTRRIAPITSDSPLYVRFRYNHDFVQGVARADEFIPRPIYSVLDQSRLEAFIKNHSIDYVVLVVGSHPQMFDTLPSYFADTMDKVFHTTWKIREGYEYELFIFHVSRAIDPLGEYPVSIEQETFRTLVDQAHELTSDEIKLLQALDFRPVLITPPSHDNLADYGYLAETFARHGEIDRAAIQYHVALSEAPARAAEIVDIANRLGAVCSNCVGPYMLMGDAYRTLGQFEPAHETYFRALAARQGSNTAQAIVHRGLGLLCLSAGQNQQAIQEFEQSMQLSDFGAAKARQQLLIAQGNLYRASGEIAQSVSSYQQAIAISPDGLVEAYVITKANMAEESKAYEETLAAYRQAFALALDNPKVRDALLEAHLAWGDQYFDQELLSEVIAAYEKDIELDPDNVQAYWKLAEVYKTLGRMDEATVVYARIVERWPESFDAHLYLAQAYETVGQMDRAITVYKRAVERWPDRAEAHFYLGQAYEAQGKTEAASAAYKTAIESEPRLAGAYIRLGNIYKAQDSAEEATALYRAAAKRNRDAAWPHIELGKIYLEQANLR